MAQVHGLYVLCQKKRGEKSLIRAIKNAVIVSVPIWINLFAIPRVETV